MKYCGQKTVIRGTEYPSITAAAKALGVTKQAVWRALEEGRVDGVGQGLNRRPAKECYINGARWNSRTAAARALRVSTAAISSAIAQGRTSVRVGGVGRFV